MLLVTQLSKNSQLLPGSSRAKADKTLPPRSLATSKHERHGGPRSNRDSDCNGPGETLLPRAAFLSFPPCGTTKPPLCSLLPRQAWCPKPGLWCLPPLSPLPLLSLSLPGTFVGVLNPRVPFFVTAEPNRKTGGDRCESG